MATIPSVDAELIVDPGKPGCGEGFHFPCVTVSGIFKKKYWVRCWEDDCSLRLGPFPTHATAFEVVVGINRLPLESQL